MQLVPRYLVSNRTTIVVNETGFVTEYRPVYNRQLQVYKGIDNKIEFRVLNADQKPIDISAMTPKFIAFDENQKMVLEHDGTLITNDDSSNTRGLFQVTISENDLLNVKQQYLTYNIYLVDNNNGMLEICSTSEQNECSQKCCKLEGSNINIDKFNISYADANPRMIYTIDNIELYGPNKKEKVKIQGCEPKKRIDIYNKRDKLL